MQKKLVSALFGATGLMLTTAFSGVYGMNNPNDHDTSSSRALVVYAGEQKPKASPTGLFTQAELNDLQHILTDHFKTVYATQEDGDMHAYLFVQNPNLVPYAKRICDHLHEMSDQSQPSHQEFFRDFRTYIQNDNVSTTILLFSIARFQTIRDEHKTRNPQQLAEEKSFVASLPNPSEAIYSVLTRPAFKDGGSFYALNDVINELQELIKKPSNPGKPTFGYYSFKTTEQMTEETCKKLVKALFTEIPPHIPMPIVGKGYLPMPLIVENLINDLFPAAFPFSTSQGDLMAHGLHFSDTTFSIHDFVHMLADPRDQRLYRYAENLLQEELMKYRSEAESISAVVACVAAEYAEFKKLLTQFFGSPAAKSNPLAIRGLFWILHEESSTLEKVFSIEARAKSMAERFHDLVAQAKNDIDSNLKMLDMSLALSRMDMENEATKIARETEANINEIIGLGLRVPAEAQLATEACSEEIQALLFAADSSFKKRVEESLSKRTEHSKVLTYVTYSKQFTDIQIVMTGLLPESGALVPTTPRSRWDNYPSIKSSYALQIEAHHNLKALQKPYQRVPFLEINPHVPDTTNQSAIRRYISDVNEGLKANIDVFGLAMNAFLTSERT